MSLHAPKGTSFPPAGSYRPGVRTVSIRPLLGIPPDTSVQDAPATSTTTILWDVWMLVLTLASLSMVGYVQLKGLAWPDPTFRALARIDLAFVTMCFAEFWYRFAKAPSKGTFFKQNWYELAGLVPMYADSLAWMRAARIFRIMRVARLLRVIYATRRISRSVAYVKRVLAASHIAHSFSIFAGVAVVMACAFYLLERGTNPQIRGFDDALWWAATTAATVGYGDVIPATGAGRLLAIVMMLFGLGFMGVITSSLSAALVLVSNIEVTEEIMITANDSDSPSLASDLAALAVLHRDGELTETEFQAAKAKVLR